MMPPFESLGGEDHPFLGMEGASCDQLAYHYKMMKEAGEHDKSYHDDDDAEEDEDPSHEHKRELPPPFPNEALLDKLSSKLAQEEEEQSKKRLGQKKAQQVGSPVMMFKVDDAGRPKKTNKASAPEEVKAEPAKEAKSNEGTKRTLKGQAKDAKKQAKATDSEPKPEHISPST
jgi:hypothetical protein